MKRIARKPAKFTTNSVFIDISTNAHQDVWAEIDLVDWDSVKRHRWSATKRANGLYVRNWTIGLLHRFIMDPPEHLVVDHIDGNPLNNRRSNLRVCTPQENWSFAADRHRGFVKRIHAFHVEAKPHVVTRTLADGSRKQYVYPSRSKTGTKRVVVCKISELT